MKLSVESFQSIMSFIGAGADMDGDRRRRPRMDISSGVATIRIQRAGQAEEEAKVIVRDVSPEGIGVIHTQPLRMGDKFVLRLQSDSGKSRDILCTVMRWRPEGEKQFSIGAVFTQEISVSDLAA